MSEKTSEQSSETRGHSTGPQKAGYDSYRSVVDPNFLIFVPKGCVPPLRYEAGGWELLQSSIELKPEAEAWIEEWGYLIERSCTTTPDQQSPQGNLVAKEIGSSRTEIVAESPIDPGTQERSNILQNFDVQTPPPIEPSRAVVRREPLSEDGRQDLPSAASSLEVEFALVITRMIDSVSSSPQDARNAIYSLARYKLQEQLMHAPYEERSRVQSALEVAIGGVETFAAKHQTSSDTPHQQCEAISENREASLLPVSASLVRTKDRSNRWPHLKRTLAVVATAATVLIAIQNRASLLLWAGNMPRLDWKTASQERSALPLASAPAITSSPSKPATLRPTDYGVYAINDDTLIGLNRIDVSTALTKQSRTTLPNGHPKFLVFSRDLATALGERIEVRVLAKVAREIPISGAKTTLVEPTWVIRNISFSFRASPVKENPEMNELHSEDPALELPAGRYALVLKMQAYEFSVVGEVVDPRHCVERIIGSASISYSACMHP